MGNETITGCVNLSNLDLIIIGLFILIAIFLINRTKRKQENFQNKQVSEVIRVAPDDKTIYRENLFKQDEIMRNNLNDFISTQGLDANYPQKSMYQTILNEKTDIDKFYKSFDDVPEFKFEGNRPFAFDRLDGYKPVVMELKKEEPQSLDISGIPNYIDEGANGFAYNQIDQGYTGDLDISGGNFGTTTARNIYESEAGF
jgi:hypothetical protein